MMLCVDSATRAVCWAAIEFAPFVVPLAPATMLPGPASPAAVPGGAWAGVPSLDADGTAAPPHALSSRQPESRRAPVSTAPRSTVLRSAGLRVNVILVMLLGRAW